MMLVELDGRWINPEKVETVEDDNSDVIVTMASGASIILVAMEAKTVAEALTVSEKEVGRVLETDGLMHYHDLGRSTPLCWGYIKPEAAFQWTDNLEDVSCNDCKQKVLARRPKS